MSTPDSDLENILRAAPTATPPPDLKGRLTAQVRLPASAAIGSVTRAPHGNWLRRWWPALAPGAVTLACAAVMTLQQFEISELKRGIQVLAQSSPVETRASNPALRTQAATRSVSIETSAEELERLQKTANELSAQIAQLESLRTENETLRQSISSANETFSKEEAEAMQKGRERAESIRCINNMKQIALAARIWAGDDDKGRFPPDMLSMTNELNTPKILSCPSDPGHPQVDNWGSYSAANCSYEYLAPLADSLEPTRVLLRCPVHGHVALCDGSVQGDLAKTHPERFVERNGALYLR